MNKLFFLLLSCSFLCSLGSAHTVIEDHSQLNVETPALAERKTRKLRLENGLEAFLISDPGTSQSGAALAVAVGSWDDPKDRPGMAHFVEHLLFLGTEKYPEEEGYTRFLDEHSGTRNAFTMADRTVYMFSVNNDGFLGALDRFGHFFISPLFTPSGVDRECKAIHQEFCKDVPLDPWRALYVKKELANHQHPFHSFCIGNSDTLAKISQDELKAWYRSHYSANLMRLVVYSQSDLDTLEKEVSTLFSSVENKKKIPSKSSQSLFCSECVAKMIAIAPVQELQVLELSWELPRFFGVDKDIHADKLVSHILGHEGPTSLLAQLKRENLAEGLSIGNFHAGNDQCIFSFNIQLTSKGVKEYEKVIERAFEALASIKQAGVPRYIFDEVQKLEELDYRFQSRQEVFQLVMDYATHLVDEPIETFPRKTLIPSVYDPEKIQELLSHLRPESCQYTLIAKPSISHVEPTLKEKWLGVKYSVLPIKQKKIEHWAELKPHPSISIPRPNPFLPEKFNISFPLEDSSSVPSPYIIAESPFGKFYSAPDNRFSVPEVHFTFRIKTPSISDSDPKSQVKADLLCQAVKEELNPITYEASLAGLSYSLKPSHYWIELKISGYSDKSLIFLDKIVHTLKNVQFTREQFLTYQELLKREYLNNANETPLKQGGQILSKILYRDFANLSEKSEALQTISYEDITTFCQSVFQKSYIEAMLYGNVEETNVKHIWTVIEKAFCHSPYPLNQHPKIEIATLPDHPKLLLTKSEQTANAVILTTDCGDFSFKKRAAHEILTKGLEEPFFSELRTRQQTAYVVTNWSQEIERHLYSFFAIQSSSHDSRDLLSRFELFLESSLQNMHEKTISKERFESIRSALVDRLQHPAENLQKMGGLLHTLAFDYDGDFTWLDKRISGFQELTYQEFLDYAHDFLGKKNPKRLAICVNGALPTKEKVSYSNSTTTEKIKSEIQYRGREKNLLYQPPFFN